MQQSTLCCFDCVHFMDSGYGVTTDGVTTFVNASTCNYYYRPDQPPIVFDLPNKE